MSGDYSKYKHNHYVPEWYQRRFMLPDQAKLQYLDLNPEVMTRNGHSWARRNLLIRGPKLCFAQDDLYTTRWGTISNVDIERFFFGELDDQAKAAVKYFSEYDHTKIDQKSLHAFIRFMSVQKLRTPKGLAWLRSFTNSPNHNFTLQELQRLQNLFSATWTDAVWQIADASQSPTKFIVSDNPVTIYNRECFPGSAVCLPPNDPDIRRAGTQTIFPLSLDKVLLVTNRTWVRNPYQDATKMGPNRRLMRDAMFNFTEIQTERVLNEEEVREINYIIKRRALRYIAAAEKDWLYPEQYLRSDHWRKMGDGYLLMPDPRHVVMGGSIYVGYKGGRSEAFGSYGHRPWEPGYEDEARDAVESRALLKFQDEFSAMFGPKYRGISMQFGRKIRREEMEEFHRHHLDRDRNERKKPGERQRRRRLMRVS
ncbi:DUF4238 domain-containing protein [Caulobacter sp. S45]|uniref:DUF4238 domain-containing protein n=1 Tax=Caulobacter sp. S45 TaxID=1641861 RepID=UPI00131D23E0|nr:DUF4238 domain-containing protein [Caulobacter sp. S45]